MGIEPTTSGLDLPSLCRLDRLNGDNPDRLNGDNPDRLNGDNSFMQCLSRLTCRIWKYLVPVFLMGQVHFALVKSGTAMCDLSVAWVLGARGRGTCRTRDAKTLPTRGHGTQGLEDAINNTRFGAEFVKYNFLCSREILSFFSSRVDGIKY